ncbi:MAG TPA: 4Fe-4S single cluster domain-containing protein [Kofleriaceae bacterium]
MTLGRIHALEPRSRANGPGVRFVVWVQGCTLGCAGCFNPTTHDAASGTSASSEDLLAQLAASPVEGLTLSGGEPFQQPAFSLSLLEGARALGLSTLVFSGYALDELPDRSLLPFIDVLVDGRYVAGERLGAGLRGSSNQQIRLLSSRYTLADVTATPPTELRILPNGEVILTGVDPIKASSLVRRR